MELRNYTNLPEKGTRVFSGGGKYSNIRYAKLSI